MKTLYNIAPGLMGTIAILLIFLALILLATSCTLENGVNVRSKEYNNTVISLTTAQQWDSCFVFHLDNSIVFKVEGSPTKYELSQPYLVITYKQTKTIEDKTVTPKKFSLQIEFKELQDFMTIRVPRKSHINAWNAAREDAKVIFSTTAINMLDASGYVTQFKLVHS